jgi:hypothetical protein
MILFKGHRGWTYTIEYFTDESQLPHIWIIFVHWCVFDREKLIQQGNAVDLTEAEKLAKNAIDWRAS